MTLLNSAAMFAAAAVIIPILVHLQKRRKSKVVDWPAMQFLKRTVTSRRRGLTLENLLLLLVRCLLVLVFVLAMARPSIEAGRHLSSAIFSLLAGCGLLMLTTAIVSSWQRRNRLIGAVIAALLFGVAGATLSTGPESLVDAEIDRDIALVIDSSLTMTLSDDEASHFDKAIAEARSLVRTLSGNSTVSIVLAGPLTETVDGSPFRNLRKAEKVLDTLSPVAGGSDLESAIQQATSLLKRAPNPRKQVLLLTDDQLCTWESIDKMRLKGRSFVSNPVASVPHSEVGMPKAIDDQGIEESGHDSDAEIACAAMVAHLSNKATNISVDRLQIKSSFVTANRPLPMEVEVRNGGSTTVRDVPVKLLVDGREIATDTLIQIEPGVSSTVRFLHVFPQAGQHVISGTIEIADQLPEDNRFDAIVDVIPHLSVLVVNGSTAVDPAQQSATFAQLALDPASLRELPPGGETDGVQEENAGRPILATTIEANRLNAIESLESFQLVLLCDVPRLPIDVAERLASFVQEGGGLWIIPGEESDMTFYNNWCAPLTEQTIMPALLEERSQWSKAATPDGDISTLGVALDLAGRPFVSDLFERGNHDLADISVLHYWKSTPTESALVGMQLTNGAPLFAEHTLGRGRVLMQSISLTRRDSTFPTTLGFPVLMHLWTYHLAASQAVTCNIAPTSEFLSDLATRMDRSERIGTLQLIEPDGKVREIPVSWEQETPLALIDQVVVPGVYQLKNRKTESTVASFAVQRDPEESELSIVSEDRLNEISQELGIEFINDASQLTTPIASEAAGTEIWDTLLFAVLWLLGAECLVTTWIRHRRGMAPIANSVSNGLQDRNSPVPLLAIEIEVSDRWEDSPLGDPKEDSVSVSGGA